MRRSARNIPYAIIGGIAVQRWGQPHLTRDLDLTLLLTPGREEATLREIIALFPARIEDAVAFALKHRVLPVNVPGGRRWLEELAQLADDPEVLPRFERIWAEHGPRY